MDWEQLIAAIIGGTLSLLGSVSAINLQFRYHDRQRKDAAKELFIDLIGNIFDLSAQLNSIYETKGYASYAVIDKIEHATVIFTRNFEQTVLLSDPEVRKNLRHYMHDVFHSSQILKSLQNQIDEMNKIIQNDHATPPASGALTENQVKRGQLINSLRMEIIEIKSLSSSTIQLKTKISALK